MSAVLVAFVTLIGVIVSAVATLLVSHWTNSGRVDRADASTIFTAAEQLRADLQKEVDSLRIEVHGLQSEALSLRTEQAQLRAENRQLREEVQRLRAENGVIKTEAQFLRRKVEEQARAIGVITQEVGVARLEHGGTVEPPE